jgi:hypothetical protein
VHHAQAAAWPAGFARSDHGYPALFSIGAAALLLAFAIDVVLGRPTARAASGRPAA